MKNFILGFIVLLLVAVFVAWDYVRAIYMTGVPDQIQTELVRIPSAASFDEVVGILDNNGFLENVEDFRWLAGQMNYIKPEMRAGQYKIQAGWTNRELLTHLRGGKQEPVKVILTYERLPEDVAGKVSQFIEADSLSLLDAFRSPQMLAKLQRTPENLMALFIPNTYEFFWNSTSEDFLNRMQKEQKRFWEANNRAEKAKKQGVTPDQAYVIASIVEKESNYNPEKPRIAGVYLNRFRTGMKLQADPTAVFATRDFATKRVTNYHINFDSPFNTYMYEGLPPGPICMAGIPSIDAVLNAEKHDYLFFCAKPDAIGQHAFAETLSGHNVNVEKFRKYQRDVLQQY